MSMHYARLYCKYLSLQANSPYNKGAFKVMIDFPPEYPFKPPKLTFKTPIYHPNVDDKGQICLPIVMAENWKPATKVDQGNVIKQVIKVNCTCSFSLLSAVF